MNILKVTRLNQDLTEVQMLINERNVIEVTEKDATTSWMKYWDGERVRSAVVCGKPFEVLEAQ